MLEIGIDDSLGMREVQAPHDADAFGDRLMDSCQLGIARGGDQLGVELVDAALAALIGFLIVFTPATAPASNVLPFIMAASSSFFPSLVNTAPLPALNNGLSSSILTLASTASKAEPPLLKIAPPFSSASIKASV